MTRSNTLMNKLKTKIKVLAKFKFVLAFENTNKYRDWVTEKIIHAFLAGSVPVYWGASNIDEWLPGPHSAIIAKDFSSPQKLAEYLLMLDRNDEQYMRYFEWKKNISSLFKHHRKNCAFDAECRVCEYYNSKLTTS